MDANQDNKSLHVPWAELPKVPLERIYSFLERKDQVNMSLVCHNWYEGYKSPSVWKNFTFDLKSRHLYQTPCPVLKCAVEKYSNMFKYVKIKYNIFLRNHFHDVWCNRFIEFLEILTRSSELIQVEFQDCLALCLRQMDEPTYRNICRVLGDFLESQHKLQRVEFTNFFFRFSEGVELLRRLIRSNSESLRHLRLRGFVKYDVEDHRKTNFQPHLLTLSDLPNLSSLDTDYSLIFINMVSQAAKSRKAPALSKIILVYHDQINPDMCGINDSKGLRGLNSTDWQFLRKKSPDLQVNLVFYSYSMTEKVLEFLIVPKMPIVRFDCNYSNISVELDTAKLFDHLLDCKVNNHLEYLGIRGFLQGQDLVSPFSSFLPTCPKLKSLEIWLDFSKSVTDLFQDWLNHKPEYLEEVIIHILPILNEDHGRMIQNFTYKYLSLLESIGLNIRVVMVHDYFLPLETFNDIYL